MTGNRYYNRPISAGELMNEVNALTRERDELRAAIEQFRADLGIYGDHLDSCLLRQENVAVVGRSRCNCGYFEAVGRGLGKSNC